MAVGGATRTLPWSWYVDPAALRLEQERIFRRFWQYAGRADEVAEPGSYSATRVGRSSPIGCRLTTSDSPPSSRAKQLTSIAASSGVV